jgi:hypothetical protein
MLLARDVRRRGFRLLVAAGAAVDEAVASAGLGVEAAAAAAAAADDDEIRLTTNLTSFRSSPQACHSFRILE